MGTNTITAMTMHTSTHTVMHTRTTLLMSTARAATTTMEIPMDMRTNTLTEPLAPSSLLQLIWLASPALPVGGFSYSEGLEAAVDAGLVSNEATASDWLVQQLHLTLARADLPVIAQALIAWRKGDHARVRALNAWLLQTRETAELRLQTEQMGRSLREWLRNLPLASPATLEFAAALEPTYPVLFALTAAGSGAGERDVLLSYAFGWAENMMQAALKAVPLGQTSGQRILARLASEIPVAVGHALALHDEDLQAFSPMLAILSSRHETQYSRLFRS
jgi:urease accessory protein